MNLFRNLRGHGPRPCVKDRPNGFGARGVCGIRAIACGCLALLFASSVESAEVAAEPAIYQKFTIPTSDGRSGAAIFVPGREAGSIVLLLPDLTAYRLVPMGTPTPAPPLPPPSPPSPPSPLPTPQPQPTPSPVPRPLVGLAKTACGAVGALPKDEATRMAAVFEAIAARADDGTLSTAESIVAATKEARRKTLGEERFAAWNAWTATIGAALNAEAAAGRLASPADHATAWRAIAEGLRRAAS